MERQTISNARLWNVGIFLSRLKISSSSLPDASHTYFSYVHSIMSYGIIFWGNSPHSGEIFKTQKRTIRIIMNSSKNASCQQLFKELNILPIQSQHIFSILLFVIKNKDQFLFNSQVHKINIRQTSNLYLPSANLAMYQKMFITQELRSIILYQQPLKIYLLIRINSN